VRGYKASDLLDPCRRYCTPDVAETLAGLAASRPVENPLETLGTLNLLDTAPHHDGSLADLAHLADKSAREGGADEGFESFLGSLKSESSAP
jgi:hypothetical protein